MIISINVLFLFYLFKLLQITPNLYTLSTILFHLLKSRTCLDVTFSIFINLLLCCYLFHFFTHEFVFVFLLWGCRRLKLLLFVLLCCDIYCSLLCKYVLIVYTKAKFLPKVEQFCLLFILLWTIILRIRTKNTFIIIKKLLIFRITLWTVIISIILYQFPNSFIFSHFIQINIWFL